MILLLHITISQNTTLKQSLRSWQNETGKVTLIICRTRNKSWVILLPTKYQIFHFYTKQVTATSFLPSHKIALPSDIIQSQIALCFLRPSAKSSNLTKILETADSIKPYVLCVFSYMHIYSKLDYKLDSFTDRFVLTISLRNLSIQFVFFLY